MNGSHLKQAAIQKAKQVASAGNGNANKKRKKELKPIITTDGPQGQDAESGRAGHVQQGVKGYGSRPPEDRSQDEEGQLDQSGFHGSGHMRCGGSA